VITDGPPENTPDGEEVSDSSSQNSTLLILLILGTIALLGSIGYLVMNRLSDDSRRNIESEESCPHCNGPIQEAVANGGKWTWCHSCRKWLEYKGPVD
jgi:hypothetical protein